MPTIRKQSQAIVAAALMCLAMLSGCRRQEPTAKQDTPSTTMTVTRSTSATVVGSKSTLPEPPATTKPVPTMAATATSQLEPGSTPSIEPTSDRSPASLPDSITILTRDLPTSSAIGGPHRLWSLDAVTLDLEPLTPPDLNVTAVDFRSSDGIIAYGTSGGSIFFLERDGRQPVVYQASSVAGENITINSLSFSPDGRQLAFTSSDRSVYGTGVQGGLWLLDLDDGRPRRLASNRHLQPGQSDVSEYREFIDAEFSPDGSALLLKVSFWEYADLLVMRPVDPDPTEANLYDPDGWWRDGAWSSDGSSILLTEWNQEMVTDLAQSWPVENRQEQLVDGRQAGLFIRFPRQLWDGITFVGSEVAGAGESQLYQGANQGDGFQYETAGGSAPLCSGDFVTGVDWDGAGKVALIACYSSAEIRSLDGSLVIDLTPYLASLYEGNTLDLFWTESQ